MEALKENELRKMSYSSLKKYAKQLGVKGNMKTDKIIKNILSRSIGVSDDDSFIMHEKQIMSSYVKNEHCKFDDDKENQLNIPFSTKMGTGDISYDEPKIDQRTPAATPRRETFSVESPSQALSHCKESEQSAITSSTGMQEVIPRELSFLSDPKVEKPVAESSSRRETFSMESPSVLQLQTAAPSGTTLRKSSRKSSKSKVSFITPRNSPRLNSSTLLSVKDRPKTPATSKNSLQKGVKFQASSRVTPYKKISDFLRSRPSTPYRLESGMRRSSVKCNAVNILPAISFTPELTEPSSSNIASSSMQKNQPTLQNTPGIKKRDSSTPKLTPGAKVKNLISPKLSTLKKQKDFSKKVNLKTPVSTPKPVAAKSKNKGTGASNYFPTKINTITPRSTPKHVAEKSNSKRTGTPNFQKIHQKAFMKMESIDEYHKRKLEYSVKKTIKRSSNSPSKHLKKGSKIPVLNSVPFVTSTKAMTFNFGKSDSNVVSRNTRLQKASAGAASVKVFSAGKNVSVKEKSAKKSFDLKASLARKLTYVPHKGTIKPLSEYNSSLKKNMNEKISVKRQKEKTVGKIREETKKFIHGVRINRKFEDIMKRRQV